MQPEDDDSKAVRISFKETDQSAAPAPREGGAPGGQDGGDGNSNSGNNGGDGSGGGDDGARRNAQRRGRRRGRNGKLGKRDRKDFAPKADFVPNPEPGAEGQAGAAEGVQPAEMLDSQSGDAQPGNAQPGNRNGRPPRVARGPGARGARGQRGRDNREPNNAEPGNREPGNRGPNNRGPNGRGPNNRGPNNRAPKGDAQPGNIAPKAESDPGNGGEDHKLQKLLAEAGLGSRRDMEEAITAGRVSVNGKVATLGQRITRRDVVRHDGKQVKIKTGREAAEVIIYNKPTGEIVSHDDPEGRPSVFDKVPAPTSGKWIAIGRLDFNTEGLLILTTSGDLANKMMHPRYEVEREYSVRVIGELTDDQMDQLLDGVELDDGPARFLKLEEGHFSDETPGINRWYDVMIREGRNREVRRMFEAVGVTVSRLIRTRFGPIALPRTLRRGQMRPLTPLEIKDLSRVTPAAKPPGLESGLPGLAGLPMPGSMLADEDMQPEGPEVDGNTVRQPAPGAGAGRNARSPRGKAKRGAGQPQAYSAGGEPNGNVVPQRGARPPKGRKAGRPGTGTGAGAAAPRGKARKGPGQGQGLGQRPGQGPAQGKRRGKRVLDPNLMTLDGRRAVKRRRDDDMPPPKPVHTPVIIHRRSKLKLMPEGGGNEGNGGGSEG
ncbi:MAG: pseudouridine synthase [Betaproteobacteria bacterium]|nr:pseudouridine synthase [Betaproteobacteria bacterium]